MTPSTGRRRALVLACSEYDDDSIPRLRSPARDAEELGAVLGDPARGGYDVRTEVDCTVDQARMAIEQFLAAGRRDDLLLLYFSCHGILDAGGELHLAFRNTRQALLQSTGLSRAWVHGRLDETRAQSTVVLVDCCFSGAFVYGGMRARAAARPVDVDGLVRDPPPGKARAVLTASSATQLSFEDEMGRAEAAARPSYFTEAVVAALASGAADRDRDGRISVDDLYAFVYDRVVRGPSRQEPQRSIHGGGELVISYARDHRAEPALPPEPPDSDMTLLISPDLRLPPWPPSPRRAAAGAPADGAGTGSRRRADPPSWTAYPPGPREAAARRPLPDRPPLSSSAPPPRSVPRPPVEPASAPPQRRRPWPAAVAVLAVLVLLGALGATAAVFLPRALDAARDAADAGGRDAGGRDAGGRDTGGGAAGEPDEPAAASRLVAPKRVTAGALTVTVTGLRVGADRTEVDLEASNRGDDTFQLSPGFCTLSETGGRGHDANPFAGTWTQAVPPGTTSQRGTLVFEGPVAATTTRVTLSFSTVFGGFGGPRGITVRDIPIRAG